MAASSLFSSLPHCLQYAINTSAFPLASFPQNRIFGYRLSVRSFLLVPFRRKRCRRSIRAETGDERNILSCPLPLSFFQKKAGYPPGIRWFRPVGKHGQKGGKAERRKGGNPCLQKESGADLRMANRQTALWPSAKSEDAAAAAAVVGALPLPQGDAKQWRNGQQIISSEAAPR